MSQRPSRQNLLGPILALLGFAVFTACIPSCNMPVGQRDEPRGPRPPVHQREPADPQAPLFPPPTPIPPQPPVPVEKP